MRILIAFDGSPRGESSIADLRLAGLPAQADAVVLSVLDCRASGGRGQPYSKEAREEAQSNFNAARDRQSEVAQRGVDLVRQSFPSWNVTPEVRTGSPPWEIIQCAEEANGDADSRPFDLVAIGSRGHGEFKRLVLGSVAHRVVTTLRGSVRVSRGRPGSRVGDKPTRPPRVVVGVDGSQDAQAAVEAVASRSWPDGTRVVLASFETGPLAMVGYWEPHTIWGGEPPSLSASVADARPALRITMEAADLVRRRRPDLLITTLVKPMDPKYGLLAAAEEWDQDGADSIFVGASGVRGLARFLLGSVSTSVAMNAACSVEVVRHREQRR